MVPRKKLVTLLQMDGHFTKEEFGQALNLAFKGCEHIYGVQRQALREKYAIKQGE